MNFPLSQIILVVLRGQPSEFLRRFEADSGLIQAFYGTERIHRIGNGSSHQFPIDLRIGRLEIGIYKALGKAGMSVGVRFVGTSQQVADLMRHPDDGVSVVSVGEWKKHDALMGGSFSG